MTMTEIVSPRTAPEVELDVVVTARRAEAEGVVGLTIALPDGAALPAWSPGAHVDIDLPGGRVRQYSLCGDPADASQWRIAVLREADGAAVRACSRTRSSRARAAGAGPAQPLPAAPRRRYVFVAGGIGITPLLPMLRAADAAGAEWVLHYGGRTRASMAFVEQLTDGPGAPAPAGRGGPARPRRPAGRGRTRHARLLLRPHRPDRGRRALAACRTCTSSGSPPNRSISRGTRSRWSATGPA